jgi:8-oxo-dGTP diphosphatase
LAGELVIDTRDSHLARLIADHYSDAVAADMESAGVAEAAHRNGFPNTITVRGISDNADGGKRRADAAGWQSIGAARAAAFAVALAERIAQAPPSTWNAASRDHADQPPVSRPLCMRAARSR